MKVIRKYNKHHAWDVLKFYEGNEEIGFMNVDLSLAHEGSAFIFTMNSYKHNQGIGTKMIHHLRDALFIDEVSGDSTKEARGFWGKFNPSWNGDSFEIFFG